MAALDRDFRRQPAAEGKAHEVDLAVGQLIENVEIEMYQVVYSVEIVRASRMTETRMGRGNDFYLAV